MRWLAAILALICATSVSAQVMPVRSGEHDGFTRFTIRIGNGEDWSIDTIGSQVRFRSGDASAKYDLTSVFDRIRRNRITAVSQTDPGSALVFEMNCACQVTPFLSGDSLVVIDFRDPIEDQATGFQLPIPSPGGFAFQLPADRAHLIIPPDEEDNSADAEIASVALPIDLVRAPLSARTIEDRFSGIGNTAVNAMEQQLIKQLTRAEQQGLIEARPQTDMLSEGDNTHLEQPEKTEETDSGPSLRNLEVTTSIDRDLAGVADGLKRSSEATRCIPTSRLNMQDWATGAPFSAQIGHWRSALVGEFDRVDSEIVESLVRTYLYFGFGIEARQALGLAKPQLENHALYDAMAQIMDGGQAPSENPFSGLQACKSDAALWAALSEPDRLDMLNDEAVQKAASRLPPHVRQLLGPRLALEFARSGRTGSAEGVLRSVDRIAEPSTPELALAHASAAELRGEPELAKEKRIEVAMSDTKHSPTALIEAIDMAAQAKEQVPPDLVNLAEA
ncbi:MAG: hypothetical protein VXW58_04435, partial [Pseudomonadota bacterium]|nr:hypothetical protein [Pseudomonadota bacterium]